MEYSFFLAPHSQKCSKSGIHKSVARDRQLRRIGFHAQQLIKRVERQKLQTGARVNLGFRHRLRGDFQVRRVALVAVMDGIADEFVARIQQAEIDAPGVDADASHVAFDAR